jgi:hypothetical protein
MVSCQIKNQIIKNIKKEITYGTEIYDKHIADISAQ